MVMGAFGEPIAFGFVVRQAGRYLHRRAGRFGLGTLRQSRRSHAPHHMKTKRKIESGRREAVSLDALLGILWSRRILTPNGPSALIDVKRTEVIRPDADLN
jgi:hypothetical protein